MDTHKLAREQTHTPRSKYRLECLSHWLSHKTIGIKFTTQKKTFHIAYVWIFSFIKHAEIQYIVTHNSTIKKKNVSTAIKSAKYMERIGFVLMWRCTNRFMFWLTIMTSLKVSREEHLLYEIRFRSTVCIHKIDKQVVSWMYATVGRDNRWIQIQIIRTRNRVEQKVCAASKWWWRWRWWCNADKIDNNTECRRAYTVHRYTTLLYNGDCRNGHCTMYTPIEMSTTVETCVLYL